MRNRQDIERTEKTNLAAYASFSGESLGRHHKETEHEYRTAFQRDRDRIVHTSAFRRLEYKTQVFVNHEGDYYRTRLTHSLEVSQIARTIARAMGLNEDLTDAICLAHDLGHTPFGHAGQDALEKLMRDHGGFEHNRQSFRIITYLENPYPDFPGLNLTYEVLEGVMKHADEYDLPDGTHLVKKGFPSMEAQLCNIADAIAYNNHDIDDGLKSGLIIVGQFRDVDLWEERYQKIKSSHSGITFHQQVRMTVRLIINDLVRDLIRHSETEIASRGIKTLADVRKNGKNLVDFSERIKTQLAELKKFLFVNLYRHWRVERMSDKAGRVLNALFRAYAENPRIIPSEFKSRYENAEPTHIIICDYLAGMTDRFALDEYAKLFDPYAKV